jgi:mRNA interferase RelE/StbE
MHILYSKKFEKDLDKIKNNDILRKVFHFIECIEKTEYIHLPNIKKLKGHKNNYRYKAGDYRIGFHVDGNNLYLDRVLSRKDIYKNYP